MLDPYRVVRSRVARTATCLSHSLQFLCGSQKCFVERPAVPERLSPGLRPGFRANRQHDALMLGLGAAMDPACGAQR